MKKKGFLNGQYNIMTQKILNTKLLVQMTKKMKIWENILMKLLVLLKIVKKMAEKFLSIVILENRDRFPL